MSSTNLSGSTTDPGDRSAAEIEREVEQTRARLTGTVEELKDRVSPGTLADEAMTWLRGSGGRQFLDNLGGTLRDNPVPVMLIAAGIGWLALGGRGEPRRDGGWRDETDRDVAYPARGGAYAGEAYRPAAHAAPHGSSGSDGPSLGERAGDAAAGLRDRAEDLAGRVGAAADEAWRGAGRAWNAASDSAGGLGRGAYRLGEDAGRRVSGVVADQPLLLGAVGLALGATLGALMPSSEAEDRLMGETRDRMADRLAGLADEARQRAKETAGEQAERAGEQIGAVASQGAKALGEVARDLREAVERTAQEVSATVRDPGPDKPERGTPAGSPAGGTQGGTPAATQGGMPGAKPAGTPGGTPGSTGVTPGASPASVGGSRPSAPGTGPV